MKTIVTILTSIITLVAFQANAQMIWDDFENPEAITYSQFTGILFEQSYANPQTDGENTSATCAQYQKNPGELYDVILMEPSGAAVIQDVSGYVSGANFMSVKVLSPAAGITVQITMEDMLTAQPANYPTGRHSEYTAVTTVANQWETLTFEFQNQPDAAIPNTGVNRLVMLFGPGVQSNDTFLFDDLMGPAFDNPCEGVEVTDEVIDDFECQRNMSFDFANGNLNQAETNPNISGLNTSAICAKFTKFPPPTNDGAFGGALQFPFSAFTYDEIHVDLLSENAAQDFLIILQDENSSNLIENTLTTSGSGEWETFSVDLSAISPSSTIENIVLLLNPATDTEDEIFIDNLRLASSNSISEAELQASLSLYPVPVVSSCIVESDFVISEITVSDLAGREVYSQTGIQSAKVDLDASEYPLGMYSVLVKGADGSLVSKKLIK